MKNPCWFRSLAAASLRLAVFALLSSAALQAAVRHVYNATDFEALPALAAGDIVICHDGTYANVTKTLTSSGTASSPVIVYAENLGGVAFSGETSITISGSYLTFAGFRFDGSTAAGGSPASNKSSILQLASGSTNCRVTNCMIRNFDANAVSGNTYYWVMIRGYNHTFEYNSIEGKDTLGASVVFDMPEGSGTKSTARNHLFRFNYMGPRTNIGSNGYEGIRAGVSTQQGYNLASVFEFNYFYRTIYASGSVEPEAVSNKSSNNVYRYNTFREVRGQIALRHGDGCTVEGNFFFGAGLSNAGGVRVIGQNHLVRNNYFQDVDGSGTTSAINVYKGDSNWPSSDDGSGNEPAHNAKILHNTFVNCNQPIYIGGGSGSVNPTGVQVRNNVVQSASGDGAVFQLGYSASSIAFSGDIVYHASGNYGVTGISGVTYGTSPSLTLNSGLGYWIPSSSSNVVDAAANTVPGTGLDVRGLTRPSNGKDIGAYEVQASGTGLDPRVRGDVGPSYYDGPSGTFTPPAGATAKFSIPGASVTASDNDGNVPANTVDGSLSTRWSANGDPEWIRFDLGSTKTIEYVKIAWLNGDSRVYTFDLQKSADGSSWTTIASGLTSSGTSLALQTFNITDTATRYLRYVGHGSNVNLWNSVTEVEVWGY